MKTNVSFFKNFVWVLIAAMAFIPVQSARAATSVPQGISLQGNILNAQSLPEEEASVVFTVRVMSPSPSSCLLYEETHNLNMAGSEGNFSFILGAGARSGTGFEDTATLIQSFNNFSGVVSPLTCTIGNSYTPGTSDNRTILLSFNDSTGVHTLSQPLVVQTVPFAFNADKLQGYVPANFLKLNTIASLTQSNVESIFSVANYPKLTALLSGQTSQYLSIASNGAAPMPLLAIAPPSPTTGEFWFDTSANVLKYFDGSTVQTVQTSSSVSGNAISSGTIGGSTAVFTSGNIQTSGSVSGAVAILFDHSGAGPSYVSLRAPSNISGTGGQSYAMTLPNSPGTSGQVLATDGTGLLSWTSRTAGTVTSISAIAPVAISGTTQAPIVSVGAASTSVSGVVSLAASGGTNAGTVVQATDARLSDSRIPKGAASGDLSGTYPSPGVAKIFGTAISAAPTLPGQMLRFDGTSWTPNFVSMFDLRSTVTGAQAFGGVGCLPSQTLTWSFATDNLSCANIAITDAQITYANQSANLFFAGPTSGSAAPTYRSITAGDLPTGGYNSTYLKNGGNSFATATTFGTSDAFSLSVLTSGVARLSLLAGGNIGVGVATPTSAFHLKAGTATAGTSPLKFIAGTNLTTAEAGAVEFDGTNLYYTDSTATRRTLATTSAASTFSGAITLSGAGTGLAVTNNETVGGTLAVTGLTTFSGGASLAANQNLTLASGTGTITQTYTGTTTSASTLNANAVTTAAANTINANGLSSGSILSLSSSSTAAAAGNTGLNVAISGANATASITRTGVQSAITATGATSTNIGASFSASGANNNYGLLVPNGSIGFGVASPTSLLHLKAGSATAGTSPLKFIAGTNLTTVEAGAVEYDGTNLYFTDSVPSRRTLVTTAAASTFTSGLTMSGAGTSLAVTNNQTIGGTLTVTGLTTLNGSLAVTGHIVTAGSSATVSSGTCGTSPSLAGSDTRGVVTVGTGAVSSCVITFNSAFGSAPNCVTTWNGAASTIGMGATATTTTLTIAFSSSANGLKFNYHCLQ